jgi:WD40 repeat protein
VDTETELRVYPGAGRNVMDVVFSADGSLLATANAGNDTKPGSVTVYDMKSGRLHLTCPDRSAWGVAISPDGTRLATAGMDRKLRLWDLITGQETLSLRGHTTGLNSVAFSPDGLRIASGAQTILVWDAIPARPSRDGG